MQRAIGFEQKIRQYDRGETFVRAVIAEAGMDGFNRIWLAPEHLPSLDEIGAPPPGSNASSGRGMASRRPPAVARVLERVTATVREHGLLQPDEAVLVCVSGGPDSVCLLESLVRLRRLLRVRLEVFHFDHRLRSGSSVDAAYVRRLAARHRLPFHVRAAQDAPSEGSSVEAWATTRRTDAANDVRARSARGSSPRVTRSTTRRRRCC